MQPWWQAWLLPARPGLRQFALAAAALLLPAPALLAGPDWMLPAMACAVTLGGGLGLGWALTVGRHWLARAPASAAGVLLVSFACLAHLQLMPYWNLVLRARAVREDLRWALVSPPVDAGRLEEPTYDCGPYRSTLEVRRLGGEVMAHTPEPLQRWSPFGWRGSWFLLLRGDGDDLAMETSLTAEGLEKALGRAGARSDHAP